MLDIKYIRENVETVKAAVISKKCPVDIDALIKYDNERKRLQFDFEEKRSLQKRISKEIPVLNKAGRDTTEILADMQRTASKIKQIEADLKTINSQIENIMVSIPNIPHHSVPEGRNEQDNQVVKEAVIKENTLSVKEEHHQITERLGMLDHIRGAKITGSGFPVYKGNGALLERALINFMLDYHRERHGYEELAVPYIVNRKAMFGTGQLPKLEEDMYRINQDDLFLIPTGEVPVTNIYADEIIPHTLLPCKFVSWTPCFRREAGSYGKDTKGLQRIHQFNKVELVRFVKQEDSYDALEEMVKEAEAVLEALGLPYRRVLLCSGDMSFASAKTYDLEVWTPMTEKFLEVSSLSNFEDFQARRSSIRYRDEKWKVRFVHTLNGSGLATPRTYIALLENYLNEDGSITVPEVLRKYLSGIDKIGT